MPFSLRRKLELEIQRYFVANDVTGMGKKRAVLLLTISKSLQQVRINTIRSRAH